MRKITNAALLLDDQERDLEATGNDTLEDMTDFLLHNVKRLPNDYWARTYERLKSAAMWTNPWHQANASYVPHKLVIPDVYMFEGVFPDDAYESVNYASVGSLIARQVSATHDLKGRTIDPEGKERPWLSPEEQFRQDRLIECLVKAFEHHYNGTEVKSEEDKSALYVAWESLSSLLTALQFSPGYPESSAGFQQYTPGQLFFISLCYHMCSQERENAVVFNAALWCNFPLRLFKPFAKSFQCPENSAMHSAIECGHDLLFPKGV
ncbi:endothelin-converting enzyme-like 1 [Dermacentor andersoni]|uniref:endothelin-converting enzyme-like 1 n=1 Tax=Dermacentor andersoni TaxID=34620 RepID=UPI003B3BBE07